MEFFYYYATKAARDINIQQELSYRKQIARQLRKH